MAISLDPLDVYMDQVFINCLRNPLYPLFKLFVWAFFDTSTSHQHPGKIHLNPLSFQAPSVFQGYPLPLKWFPVVQRSSSPQRDAGWSTDGEQQGFVVGEIMEDGEADWNGPSWRFPYIFHFDKNLKGFRIRRLAMITWDAGGTQFQFDLRCSLP